MHDVIVDDLPSRVCTVREFRVGVIDGLFPEGGANPGWNLRSNNNVECGAWGRIR